MDDVKPVASDAIDLCTLCFHPAYVRKLLKASVILNQYLFGVAKDQGLDPEVLLQIVIDSFDHDLDIQQGLIGLSDLEGRCAMQWSMIKKELSAFNWEEFVSTYGKK